jgi:hypothetical protein
MRFQDIAIGADFFIDFKKYHKATRSESVDYEIAKSHFFHPMTEVTQTEPISGIEGEVKMFNTRRHYSKDGQRIIYGKLVGKDIPQGVIAFWDMDRGIDGAFFNNYQLMPTDEMVLAAYDNSNTTMQYTTREPLMAKAKEQGLI